MTNNPPKVGVCYKNIPGLESFFEQFAERANFSFFENTIDAETALEEKRLDALWVHQNPKDDISGLEFLTEVYQQFPGVLRVLALDKNHSILSEALVNRAAVNWVMVGAIGTAAASASFCNFLNLLDQELQAKENQEAISRQRDQLEFMLRQRELS